MDKETIETVLSVAKQSKKWIGAGETVPAVGSDLTVLYCTNKPSKAKFL